MIWVGGEVALVRSISRHGNIAPTHLYILYVECCVSFFFSFSIDFVFLRLFFSPLKVDIM